MRSTEKGHLAGFGVAIRNVHLGLLKLPPVLGDIVLTHRLSGHGFNPEKAWIGGEVTAIFWTINDPPGPQGLSDALENCGFIFAVNCTHS